MTPEAIRKWEVVTRSPEETQKLAARIGSETLPETLIALYGDLGSGKTTFVQGLAKGLQVPDDCYVTSPTYTLVHEYQGRFPLYHVDLYRIGGEGDLADIGFEEIVCRPAIVAVEWPDRLPGHYLDDCLSVHMQIIDEEGRKISIIPYGHAVADLIERVKKIKG